MHGPTEKWRKCVVVLQDIEFVPEQWVNLFGISKALTHGFNLGNEGVVKNSMKGNTNLYFDRIFQTKIDLCRESSCYQS
jgi:uncharacterized Fe-S cluster-containing radical SAM superfamily protein